MTELERCDAEIRQVELLLRSGHPDIEGLLLALVDWSTERRLLRAEQENDDGLARTDPETGARGRSSGHADNAEVAATAVRNAAPVTRTTQRREGNA